MSNWNGPAFEGAMRAHRESLREEAEFRATRVKLKNTKKYRKATPEQREAMEKATDNG